MKRTKFPYKYQNEQLCICEDCKQEVFKWYTKLLNKISRNGRLPLAEKLVDELPFPVPEKPGLRRQFGEDPKDVIRDHFFKKEVGFTVHNEHHEQDKLSEPDKSQD